MRWQEVVEALVDAVNTDLEVGDWVQVIGLTADLYAAALHAGETELAELVQDLHWIANDALMHPREIERVVAR
jgi:hypothetical protein